MFSSSAINIILGVK